MPEVDIIINNREHKIACSPMGKKIESRELSCFIK